MPSPPGESIRRMTPLMLASSSTCLMRRIIPPAVIPLSLRLLSAEPRVISPSPTRSAIFVLPSEAQPICCSMICLILVRSGANESLTSALSSRSSTRRSARSM